MSGRATAVLLSGLLCGLPGAAGAGEGDDPRAAGPRPPDWFLATATGGREVTIVPLRAGALPDLSQGVTVELLARGDGPPALSILHDTDVLAVQRAADGDRWTRFHRDPQGRWGERALGEWPAGGWALVGSTDLDRDGEEDLVLLRREAPTGYAPYQLRIGRGQRDGTFAWGEPRALPGGRQWNAVAALGDVDGDGKADLLFHLQPHGGTVPIALQVLPGVEGGGFAAEARPLVKGATGASTIVPGRFTRGARWEVYLPADDDVPDLGQGHLWRLGDDGAWSLRPSLDLSPAEEGDGTDRGIWTAVACDVDLDGKLDLVATWSEWATPRRWRVVVHRGDGQGGFDEGTPFLSGEPGAPPRALAWPPDAGP